MAEQELLVLAGDVGGTSARFAVVEAKAQQWCPLHLEVIPTASVSSLYQGLQQLVAGGCPPVGAACIAVAGPVYGNQARLTNLPWEVNAAAVAQQLSLPLHRVLLVNDLEAMAWGVLTLSPHEVHTLHQGQPAVGNVAVLAAGTGLGEAGLLWDGVAYHPISGEGGHADFAPRDEVEWGFARQLLARWGHASWERVLSGHGLVALYRYLVELRGNAEDPGYHALANRYDPGAAVAEAALHGSCPLAREAVQRFVGLLGAEAGNWALKLLARGGVYLGGGIPPKLLPQLKDGTFLEGFFAKGRMRALVETFPVHVILNETVGLRGAAGLAARLGGGAPGHGA